MKKIIIIFLAISMSTIIYAQDEGRGLDNRFYFRLGYSQPANSYLGWSESPYLDYLERTGWVFELGSIFIINKLDLADGLRLGINVDYLEVTYHQFTYNNNFEEDILFMGQVSSKVGPSLSFNPVSRLVLDAFVKAKIPWVGAAYFSADDPDLDEESFLGTMGFGFSTGLNIRFGVLIVGFDYSSSNLKLENRDFAPSIYFPDKYLGNYLKGSDYGDKTKMAYYNFTLGLNF